MTSAVPGGPGLPLCHRSLRASPLTRFAPSARRSADQSAERPLSRGVCPLRFGGLRDWRGGLAPSASVAATLTTSGLSRGGSVTCPTVPAGRRGDAVPAMGVTAAEWCSTAGGGRRWALHDHRFVSGAIWVAARRSQPVVPRHPDGAAQLCAAVTPSRDNRAVTPSCDKLGHLPSRIIEATRTTSGRAQSPAAAEFARTAPRDRAANPSRSDPDR